MSKTYKSINSRKTIDSFLGSKTIAIAGVSRNPVKFGNILYQTLKTKGYQVIPVNPNAEIIDDSACLKSVNDLSPEIQHLIVATNKKDTALVVSEALQKGIQNIWIQNGCETDEALQLVSGKDVGLVSKACVLMYANPAGFHKFHKTLASFFGGYVSK